MMDALFETEELPPTLRKDRAGYLATIATPDYDGMSVWALAPVDQHIRDRNYLPAEETDFVWLSDGQQLHWALVNLYTAEVIEIDMHPIDKSVWTTGDAQ